MYLYSELETVRQNEKMSHSWPRKDKQLRFTYTWEWIEISNFRFPNYITSRKEAMHFFNINFQFTIFTYEREWKVDVKK